MVGQLEFVLRGALRVATELPLAAEQIQMQPVEVALEPLSLAAHQSWALDTTSPPEVTIHIPQSQPMIID